MPLPPYGIPDKVSKLKAEGTPKLIVGPGDHGEPVITILLPNED